MKSQAHNRQLFPRWLFFLIVAALLLGICFRFTNLDQKVYWRDETATSSRISGYTRLEVLQQVYDGRLIGAEDLRKYQRPNQEKSLVDTIRSLAIEDPQHPPLYFVIARVWVEQFGSSARRIRILSALISLMAFPCLYWLCQELFESSLVGWVTIALFSVSLIHVTYAQEARQFSLWTVTILGSSAALLRATKRNDAFSWIAYSITLILGLYTFLLHGLVAIAHGFYVLLTENFRSSKTTICYLVSAIAGLFAFTPWIVIFLGNTITFQQETSWTGEKISLLSLVRIWLHNISLAFLDVNFILKLSVLILVGYSIYWLCRRSSPRIYLFLFTLMGVTALSSIIPDLLLGGKRSTVIRYMFPCFLGIHLAVGYTVTNHITSTSLKTWQRRIWQIVLVILLFSGIWTCAQFSQTQIAWSKGDNELLPISRMINQVTSPLVISDIRNHEGDLEDGMIGSVLALSNLLDPDVKFQLVIEPNIPQLPHNSSHIFLLSRYETLSRSMQQALNKKSILLHKDKVSLWKLAD